MTGKRVTSEIVAVLSETPFLRRVELASFVPVSVWGVYKAMDRLETAGLVARLPNTPDVRRHGQRYYLTPSGIEEAARLGESDVDDVLRSRPVSVQWQKLLLERLDALASVYAVAAAITNDSIHVRVRLYRAEPLDASVILPNGKNLGIVRWGAMADRTAFAKRMQRLHDGPLPGALLVLVTDEVRLRYALRLLTRQRVPTFVAIEDDAVSADSEQPVWQRPSTDVRFDMNSIVRRASTGGVIANESHLYRTTPPEEIRSDVWLYNMPAHRLPATLHPTDKRVLDVIADWPGIRTENLRRLLDIKPSHFSQVLRSLRDARLVHRFNRDGNRLALSDRALGVLARRDRTSVGTARNRWSIEEAGTGKVHPWSDVPGRHIRQLLRHIDHTDAVHTYLASMAASARDEGWNVVQLDPPHRASRYFMHQGGQRSVHPDAFFMLRRGDETKAFFLEWERRAVRPSTMKERIAPYLRYYSTKRPLDDHGVTPTVIVVMEDEGKAARFGRTATQEMAETGIQMPLIMKTAPRENEAGNRRQAGSSSGSSGLGLRGLSSRSNTSRRPSSSAKVSS